MQHPDRSRREWETFDQIVEELHRPSARVRLHRHDNVAEGILEEIAGHDLVIIGARFDSMRPNALIGRQLQRIVRRVEVPVLMIRPTPHSPELASDRTAANGHGG
jgi:nucleotide-binding universal stress UspA family protein